MSKNVSKMSKACEENKRTSITRWAQHETKNFPLRDPPIAMTGCSPNDFFQNSTDKKGARPKRYNGVL